MNLSIIDAHAHCGIQDRFPPQAFEDYARYAKGTGISEVVMFAPVAEIYDRYDFLFEDNAKWQERRKKANAYLLTIGNAELKVTPYFFIWNDFAVDQLMPQHQGIKWHRHENEPVYHYDDPLCLKALEEIRRRNLPVVLEEELKNTIRFIQNLAQGIRVIIPHLGLLNGSYRILSDFGIWKNPNVFTDTALAPPHEIYDYIRTYGHDRIMFGSDFPFGTPRRELEKILQLQIPDEIKEAITCLNIKHLLSENKV